MSIALFVLVACASNKPIVEQATTTKGDDPRCKELMSFIPQAIESFKMPAEHYEVGNLKCEVTETMFCDNVEYAFKLKCPSMERPMSIFETSGD